MAPHPPPGGSSLAVAVVAYLLPLRALLHAPGAAMEEGFMLVFPDRVLHGAVPNKDFLYLYGPGSLWLLAAVYKVFGTHLVVERLAGLAQLVGMAVAAGLLVRWWGRWVAVAAVLLTSCSSCRRCSSSPSRGPAAPRSRRSPSSRCCRQARRFRRVRRRRRTMSSSRRREQGCN